MSKYDTLNPMQREAVFHTEGPLLVLAGAGSGKTRVLTHRIAYLIEEKRVAPWNIMAITFTNKAAAEMRERVDKIVGEGAEAIWVSTFHSSCVRILRRFIDRLGYDTNFTIYDGDDQKTLMKQVLKKMQADPKQFKERAVLSRISAAKNDRITADEFEQQAGADFREKKIAQIYREYQKELKKNNALDFDDLLVKTVELFEANADVLEYYQDKFRYIMVDEYQDTNLVQFKLVDLLAKKYRNICVVGDDDQSIYKFRGANIENILSFEKAFPGARVIKLEQNYRSTQSILNAANEVIRHNRGRKDKTLWTANDEGPKVRFRQYDTAYEEADAIIRDIEREKEEKNAEYSDFAVLYRTNAQSRLLEEKCIYYSIPYRLVGGVNFYQRKEIKDILCYLKTIANGRDDLAVQRVINVPKRGIGLTTIDRVADYALTHETSFYGALQNYEYIDGIKRSTGKLGSFVSLIESFKRHLASPEYSLEDLIREIIEETGYVRLLEEEDTEEANGRIENIEEFINKVVTYEENCEEEPTLSGFLEEVALVADIDTVDDDNNMVLLMTLHSAKGLEFPYVYLVGMEDGIFPGYAAVMGDDPEEMEEERRLCYVGITRAKQKLSLSCARSRFRNGEQQYNRPSSFLNEIPRYLLKQNGDAFQDSSRTASSPFSGNSFTESRRQSYHQVRINELPNVRTNASSTWDPMAERSAKQAVRRSSGADLFAGNPLIRKGIGSSSQAGDIYRSKGSSLRDSSIFDKGNSGKTTSGTLSYGEGDRIKHKKFGEGTVIALKEKNGDHEVTVDFDNGSTRRMMASFAKLKKI